MCCSDSVLSGTSLIVTTDMGACGNRESYCNRIEIGEYVVICIVTCVYRRGRWQSTGSVAFDNLLWSSRSHAHVPLHIHDRHLRLQPVFRTRETWSPGISGVSRQRGPCVCKNIAGCGRKWKRSVEQFSSICTDEMCVWISHFNLFSLSVFVLNVCENFVVDFMRIRHNFYVFFSVQRKNSLMKRK